MNFIKKHKFIFGTILFITVYFTCCLALYMFEPPSYDQPELDVFKEYFDMYSQFDKNKDDEFYIKQVATDDICAVENDIRLKYVANTAIGITSDDINLEQVTSLLNEYDAQICGYIKDVNFYQFEFNENLTYTQLYEICNKITNDGLFLIVIPDYFEETPASYTESQTNLYTYNEYYYNLINAYEAWEIYYEYDNEVNVGLIDVLVDYNNDMLNVVNTADYKTDCLFDFTLNGAEAHGTHVAGIINAQANDDMHGIAANSCIFSCNGVNVSTSYWIASICDMLLRQNVKVVNISMGYNSYISISAQLGDENALEYINNENKLFSEILNCIIKDGNEFVICNAAGNSTSEALYRTPFAYFGYGEKKILEKIDLFDIFKSCPEYVDAKYSFFISDSANNDVADRVITVGCIGEEKKYTYFSNAGEVDIVAPGENIYSTVLNGEYEYMSGTSMSTPFVSGAAAMIFTVNPGLDGSQVKEILLSSSTEKVCVYEFEYPILNVGEAVKLARTY